MDAVEDAVCNRRQYANPGNFARLAKFRYVAKITVPSEILQFRYL